MVLSTDGHLVCIRSFWMFFMFSPLGYGRKNIVISIRDIRMATVLSLRLTSFSCVGRHGRKHVSGNTSGNTFQPGQLRSKQKAVFSNESWRGKKLSKSVSKSKDWSPSRFLSASSLGQRKETSRKSARLKATIHVKIWNKNGMQTFEGWDYNKSGCWTWVP